SAATTIALTATSLIGLMSTALPVAAAPKATAPKATPAPVPGYVRDLGISGATSMVSAAGKLFIGVGDTVQVRDLLGNPIQTISGETGVSALLASPDGSTVYAADRGGSAISVIDAASAIETAHWPVSGCPTSLALANGLLFDSYGCGTSGGIESIDPAAGGPPTDSGITNTFSAAPLLAGYDGEILAAVAGTSTAYAYSQAGPDLSSTTATTDTGWPITALATMGNISELAIAGRGTGQVSYYDNSLDYFGGFASGGDASALAYAASATDGQLAAGLSAGGSAAMQTFDGNTTEQITSVTATAPGQTGQLAAVPGALAFGPDTHGHPNAMIYGLATAAGSSHDYLEAGPANALAVPQLTIGVGSPQYYGGPLLVAVTFPGHPNLPLSLHVHPSSGLAFALPVHTNQWGVAVTNVPVTFSGQIFAAYAGDVLTYHELPGNTATVGYTTASSTSASMVGSFVSRGGVRYYHSAAGIQLQIAVVPQHVRQISVVLQVWQNQLWLSAPPATFTTNRWGVVELYLPTAKPGLIYRARVTTPASTLNRASTAQSPGFAVG
ncbi:MAG: hypothetical protein ABI418_14805, partial [Jatrophihabitantaceae bacterium]